MKYSAEKVNNMSYSDWMETIAKELNAAGFKAEGYSEEHHRFMKNIAPYIVRDVRYFFMGAINDAKAMDYLKFIGLNKYLFPLFRIITFRTNYLPTAENIYLIIIL